MVTTADRSEPRTLVATVARRSLEALATAWAAVSLTFIALRLGVGNPVASLLSQGLATPEQAAALSRQLGFDAPLPTQYLRFMLRLLQGDLGVSLYTGRPVLRVIIEQLPPTVRLAVSALVIAVVVGFVLGALAGWYERSRKGWLAETLAGLATAIPVAFVGVMAILILNYILAWLPGKPQSGWIHRFLMPTLVLGFASSGGIARVVHAGLRETLQAQYVMAARARGIGRLRLLITHALRPALPAAVSMSALQAAFLLTGTVVTETVFARPGLGRLLVTSILQGDYPIAQGLVVLAAIVYTGTNLVAEVLSLLLDPRMRRGS